MDHYLDALKKYADFQGRATRSNFWYFVLFNLLIALGLLIISKFIPFLVFLYFIYALLMILPNLAVTVRRLHDIGKSGWWIFIALVPLVGGLYLIYLLVLPSK